MNQGHRTYSIPHPTAPRPRRWPHPLTVLMLLCGLFIVYGTTIPFEPVEQPISIAEGWKQAIEASSERSSRTDRVANVLLFLPLGAVFAARLARSGVGLIGSVLLAAMTGATLSISVETLQINLQMRVTSVSDVMTNTAGAILGGIVGWTMAIRVWPLLEPKLRLGVAAHPLAMLAVVASSGWALVEFAPFVPSLDFGELKQSIRSARPIPFGPSIGGVQPDVDRSALVVEMLTWVLLGGLIALALQESGRRGGVLIVRTVVLAALVRTGVEVLQLIFPGHVADATQIILAMGGAAVAATVITMQPSRSLRSWTGPALAVWWVAMVIEGIRPFDTLSFTGQLHVTAFFPFYSYFLTPPPAALTIAAEKVASTVPMGTLLALRYFKVTPMTAALVGGAFGLGIESIQMFNAARIADFTDVFLAGFGAWVGALAVRSWGAPRSNRANRTG